ncbi:MAG TPA: hypothetical protein VNT51_07155, partial [Miltoncostaeaceae bacterium]|nr:hypothetical protein [Miltoncostaeaceae bacterium]
MGIRGSWRGARVAAAAALLVLGGAGSAAAAPPFGFSFGDTGTPESGRLGAVGGDLAVDSDGSVWAEDRDANRVVKYDANGTFVAEFTGADGLATPLDDTQGIGADAAGGVYVVDEGGTRVVKLDTGGRLVRVFGAAPPAAVTDAASLTNGEDVAVSADGVVHVLEAGRILRFRQDGSRLGDVVLPFSITGGRDLVVAPSGDYYLNTTSRIVRLSPAGAETAGVAVFASGEGLAVDTSGAALRVYGKTQSDGRVSEYGADLATGSPFTAFDPADPAFVTSPNGIAVDCRGSVYVLDRNPAGARILKFVTPGTPPPPCAPPAAPAGPVETQINDIDVTQGVQWDRDHTAQDVPGGPRTRGFGLPGAPAEVPMRAGGTTVVRVFANLRSGPPGGVANIPATLTANVPGGRRSQTLMPDASPPVLRVGDARVEPAERTDVSAAYTFTLPDEWTAFGRITLTATVNPAGIGCDEACRRRSTFVLTGVPFQQTTASCLVGRVACVDNPFGVDVWPVALQVNGRDPIRDPRGALDVAHTTTPVRLIPWGWMGQIDITDAATATTVRNESCFLGIELGILCDEETVTVDRTIRQGWVMERLERFKEDRNVGSGTIILGLTRNAHPDLPGAMRGRFGTEPVRDPSVGPFGYADTIRPLTAVTHEVQHALGRRHAGTAPDCYPDPAQLGEPWPDFGGRGNLFGYGLDTRAGSGGPRTPYRMYEWTPAAPMFDLMSYCGGEGNTWISTVGWNQIIGYRAPAGAVPRALQYRAQQVGTRGALIRVNAVEAPGRLLITGTRPDRGVAPAPDPAARYQLEARDAVGRIVSSAPMSAEVTSEGVTVLQGAVALAPHVAQVVVRRGTEAATRRRRSATAPTVRLRAPRAGSRAAGRALTVSWRAADRDGDSLTTAVEVSLDGGRSFRTVHVGPSAGRVVVPLARLGDSRNARIRVRVDDGFAEAIATSGRITIVGPPPAVRITSPARGQRVRADAPLRLAAQATAAGGRPLGARAFRWAEGRRILGRGASRTVTGLRPGRRILRVTVTDGRRTATASVPVVVTAVRAREPTRAGASSRRNAGRTAVTTTGTDAVAVRRPSVTVTRRIRRPGRNPVTVRL